jgi:hypothetical protein
MVTTRARQPLSTVTACLVFAASIASAFAEEPKRPAGLPGVDGGYSIVAPKPDEPVEKQDGPIQVGKWELTVSGYVWVQFGSGSHGDGR